jgi:hypothetical protein
MKVAVDTVCSEEGCLLDVGEVTDDAENVELAGAVLDDNPCVLSRVSDVGVPSGADEVGKVT